MSMRNCEKHNRVFHYLEMCPDCANEEPEKYDSRYEHDLIISELAKEAMEAKSR